MTKLTGPNGEDPSEVIVETLEEEKKEMTRDSIDLWFQESQDWLNEAAERRSQLGVSHNRSGRAENDLFYIHQSARPPQWSESEGGWTFVYPTEGAVFQEYGARPHEIRAKQAEVLAFEWPDAPDEVEEQFSSTEGDLVFFESVNHPGLPAIGFVKYGRDRAQNFLESSGYDTEVFEG